MDVDEWNAASKGKKLPKRKRKKKSASAKVPLDKLGALLAFGGQEPSIFGETGTASRTTGGHRGDQSATRRPEADEVGLIGVAKDAQTNPVWLGDVKLDKQADALTPTTGMSPVSPSDPSQQYQTPAARLEAKRQQALTNMRLMTPQGVRQQTTASATGSPTMNSTQNVLSGWPSVNEVTGQQRHWGNALPQIFGITLNDTKLAADSARPCAICNSAALERWPSTWKTRRSGRSEKAGALDKPTGGAPPPTPTGSGGFSLAKHWPYLAGGGLGLLLLYQLMNRPNRDEVEEKYASLRTFEKEAKLLGIGNNPSTMSRMDTTAGFNSAVANLYSPLAQYGAAIGGGMCLGAGAA